MEIRKIDPARLTFKDAVELADVALDGFRNDPIYVALNMRYGDKHYTRARLSYALLLASKLWHKDVCAWVAVKNQRVIGFCRWEKLSEVDNGVSRVWIWVADAARWLVNLYASIFEPPHTRPVNRKEVSDYFSDVSKYFDQVVPLPESTPYLGLLCSRQAYQRQGVGSSLLKESMRDITAGHPSTRLRLWSSAAGMGLYKKYGFQVRAEHIANLNGQQQRQTLMVL